MLVYFTVEYICWHFVLCDLVHWLSVVVTYYTEKYVIVKASGCLR